MHRSVVHCLVRKAEKNLLNHLFNHVHRLSEDELKRMLQEDEAVVQKRTTVKGLYEKVKMSIDDVQYMAEKIKRKEDDRETVRASDQLCARLPPARTSASTRRHAQRRRGWGADACGSSTRAHDSWRVCPASRPLQVLVEAEVLALAAMTEVLSGDQRRK